MNGMWFIQGIRPAWHRWKHAGWQSVVRLRKEMGKPARREAAGLTSFQKPFIDFEQTGVLLCGEHGGHQLCLS